MENPLTGPSKSKKEFFAINGIRFLAAFWVLLFHAEGQFGALESLRWLQPAIEQGPMAMTVFFVLSGYILSYRYKNFANAEDYQQFTAARIARLYPVYLFIGLVTLWTLPHSFQHYFLSSEFGLAGQLLFSFIVVVLFVLAIQAWFPSLFYVWNFNGSWSLSVEAFFYALFPHLRRALNRYGLFGLRAIVYGAPLFMMLLLAGSIASMTSPQFDTKLYYVLPIFRLPEFIFGIAGYILFVERQQDKTLLATLMWLGLAALTVCVPLVKVPGLMDWSWLALLPLMGIFVATLRAEAPPRIKQFINYLGRISYSVYMIQFATIPLLSMYKRSLSPELGWFMLIFATLLSAIATYHLVEVLCYTKTRQLSLAFLLRLQKLARSFR
jgi:peptidoglycan/LPS O-acetylase OafA/YrhL